MTLDLEEFAWALGEYKLIDYKCSTYKTKNPRKKWKNLRLNQKNGLHEDFL